MIRVGDKTLPSSFNTSGPVVAASISRMRRHRKEHSSIGSERNSLSRSTTCDKRFAFEHQAFHRVMGHREPAARPSAERIGEVRNSHAVHCRGSRASRQRSTSSLRACRPVEIQNIREGWNIDGHVAVLPDEDFLCFTA